MRICLCRRVGADAQERLTLGNRLSIASGNIIEIDGVTESRGVAPRQARLLDRARAWGDGSEYLSDVSEIIWHMKAT